MSTSLEYTVDRAGLRPGRRHEEDLGDVLFGIETYEGWASTFADHEIHMPDCFYMINKGCGSFS